MSARSLLSTLAVAAFIAGSGFVFHFRGVAFANLYERQRSTVGLLPPDTMPPATAVAIMQVNVIPMTSEIVLQSRTVLIEDGFVTAVGPADEVSIPPGYQIIDGRDRYLLPGLADMHVHLTDGALAFKQFLLNGITAVRNMDGSAAVLDWADGVRSEKILGPRIYSTGPILNGTQVSNGSLAVTTMDEARGNVQRQFRVGYRAIKPYTHLSREVYLAAIEEAKRLGMYVVGHVPYSAGTEGVLDAGQDEIAHIHSFHPDFFTGFDSEDTFREYAIDYSRMSATVAKIKAVGARVTTTLIVNQALLDAQDLDAYLDRPMQAYELSWASLYMKSPAWQFRKLWPREYLQDTFLPWIYELLSALHEAKVPLVLGTDSGVTGLVHGFSAHEELELLVKAGLTPYAALETATVRAAEVVQAGGEWGTIEVGKVANLILLRENPLEDIRQSDGIVGVSIAGRWFDEADLDRWRTDVKALARRQPRWFLDHSGDAAQMGTAQ